MQLVRMILLTLAAAAVSFADPISGKWAGQIPTRDGSIPVTLSLKADGEILTGTVTSHLGEMAIKDGKVKGGELSWTLAVDRDGATMKIWNKATVTGKEMKVNLTVEGRDVAMEYTVKKAD
jgi:hypothetical protein